MFFDFSALSITKYPLFVLIFFILNCILSISRPCCFFNHICLSFIFNLRNHIILEMSHLNNGEPSFAFLSNLKIFLFYIKNEVSLLYLLMWSICLISVLSCFMIFFIECKKLFTMWTFILPPPFFKMHTIKYLIVKWYNI